MLGQARLRRAANPPFAWPHPARDTRNNSLTKSVAHRDCTAPAQHPTPPDQAKPTRPNRAKRKRAMKNKKPRPHRVKPPPRLAKRCVATNEFHDVVETVRNSRSFSDSQARPSNLTTTRKNGGTSLRIRLAKRCYWPLAFSSALVWAPCFRRSWMISGRSKLIARSSGVFETCSLFSP